MRCPDCNRRSNEVSELWQTGALVENPLLCLPHKVDALVYSCDDACACSLCGLNCVLRCGLVFSTGTQKLAAPRPRQ